VPVVVVGTVVVVEVLMVFCNSDGPGHKRMQSVVQRGRRRPQATCLQGGLPLKLVSGVARPQGLDGSGNLGPSDTLGSPLPSLAIRPLVMVVEVVVVVKVVVVEVVVVEVVVVPVLVGVVLAVVAVVVAVVVVVVVVMVVLMLFCGGCVGNIHRRTAWGIQRGKRWPQDACPTDGPSLKWLFQGWPGCRA
jgi:hypothetical protein